MFSLVKTKWGVQSAMCEVHRSKVLRVEGKLHLTWALKDLYLKGICILDMQEWHIQS